MVRLYHQIILWQTVSAVFAIQALSSTSNYVYPPSSSSSSLSSSSPSSKQKSSIPPNAHLGRIDYGQCKRLTPREQTLIAHLVLSVANNAPDHAIATAFRNLENTHPKRFLRIPSTICTPYVWSFEHRNILLIPGIQGCIRWIRYCIFRMNWVWCIVLVCC